MTYRVSKEQLLEHCRRMRDEPQIDRGCCIDLLQEAARTGKSLFAPLLKLGILREEPYPYQSRY